MAPVAVLIGPPGAGKTTVGTLLAARLGVPFADTDVLVEARAGRTIADVFTTDGEPAFRALEREVVREALETHDGVLALGGGAVLAEATRAALDGHAVVFLTVGMANGVRRTGLSTARPLLAGVNPRAMLRQMLETRAPLYGEVATLTVHTGGRTPEEIAAEVLATLTEAAR